MTGRSGARRCAVGFLAPGSRCPFAFIRLDLVCTSSMVLVMNSRPRGRRPGQRD